MVTDHSKEHSAFGVADGASRAAALTASIYGSLKAAKIAKGAKTAKRLER